MEYVGMVPWGYIRVYGDMLGYVGLSLKSKP